MPDTAGNISESYEQLASTDMSEGVLYGVFVIAAAKFLIEDSNDAVSHALGVWTPLDAVWKVGIYPAIY